MGFIGEVGEFVPPMGLKNQKSDIAKRAPYEKPAFTLGQLKKAIPPHCFKRSIVQSLSYVVYDLTFIFTLYYVATNYFTNLPRGIHLFIWPVYFLAQGCVMFRLWLIAHECGHHAISDYQLLDDIVGLILHSSLLVPYFSWKISHRRHHSNIGSLERDEVFVPQTKSNLRWFTKYLSTNPPGSVLTLAITLGLGWPLYLLFNVSGRKYERFVSHYDPYAPLFNCKERMLVYISDICVLLVYFSLYHLALAKGLHWVMCIYGGPLLVMNALVVLTSYLQHTHPALPHYNQSEWDWLRGTLATVDRDYGILNKFFHNCINAHVVHHLFSTVPHYHVVEATNAIRPILGNYYQSDDTPFYKALWREAKECIYVEPDESNNGVFWYNNKM